MDGSVRREDHLILRVAAGTDNFDRGPPVLILDAFALERRVIGVATPRTVKRQANQKTRHAAYVLEGEGFQIVRTRRRERTHIQPRNEVN